MQPVVTNSIILPFVVSEPSLFTTSTSFGTGGVAQLAQGAQLSRDLRAQFSEEHNVQQGTEPGRELVFWDPVWVRDSPPLYNIHILYKRGEAWFSRGCSPLSPTSLGRLDNLGPGLVLAGGGVRALYFFSVPGLVG